MRETGLFIQKPEGSFTYRVGALIIRNGKLLVVKSVDHPCFYTVGGVVEMNETSEEAVIREVLEETGYKVGIDRLLCIQERIFAVDGANRHEIDLFYRMKIDEPFAVAENTYTDQPPKETLHWIPLEDLPSTNIVPASLKTLDYESPMGITHIISRN